MLLAKQKRIGYDTFIQNSCFLTGEVLSLFPKQRSCAVSCGDELFLRGRRKTLIFLRRKPRARKAPVRERNEAGYWYGKP